MQAILTYEQKVRSPPSNMHTGDLEWNNHGQECTTNKAEYVSNEHERIHNEKAQLCVFNYATLRNRVTASIVFGALIVVQNGATR